MSTKEDILVVSQSDGFGRGFFRYPDDEQAFAAMRRLLAESRSAFLNEGIERAIGIIVSDRQDWPDDNHD